MTRERLTLIGLLALQVIAVILYPPAFFQRAPQSIVLPPAFLLLFIVAILGMNTGALDPLAGRMLLVFVQGVNIVVRMIMFFANLFIPGGGWDWTLIAATVIGMVLSWLTITRMEKYPPRFLLLRQKKVL